MDSPQYYFDLSQYEHSDLFDSVAAVWDVLQQIETYLKKKAKNTSSYQFPGVYIENPETVVIGEGTTIEPGAYIRGPCILGKDCSVRHGAYIRGSFIAGDRCVIGHTTEIKNTVFLNDVHASHFAYIGDSILGNHVNLGAGTKCANLRLDQGEIVLHHNGKTIRTGLRKFGAIMGDGVQTGCNSVTNPGTLLGKSVICYPCLNIGGIVPENAVVKSSQKVRVSSR